MVLNFVQKVRELQENEQNEKHSTVQLHRIKLRACITYVHVGSCIPGYAYQGIIHTAVLTAGEPRVA